MRTCKPYSAVIKLELSLPSKNPANIKTNKTKILNSFGRRNFSAGVLRAITPVSVNVAYAYHRRLLFTSIESNQLIGSVWNNEIFA